MGKKRYSSTLGVVEPEEEIVSGKRNSPTLGVYGDVKKKAEPLVFPLPSAPESQKGLKVSSQEEPLESQSSGDIKSDIGLGYPRFEDVKLPENKFRTVSSLQDIKNEGIARLKETEDRVKQYNTLVPKLMTDVDAKLSEAEANLGQVTEMLSQDRDIENNPDYKKAKSQYMSLFHAKNMLKKADKYINTKDAGVLKTMFNDPLAIDFFTLGATELQRGGDILGIVKKYNDGKELTEEESLALFAYGLNQDLKKNSERSLSSSVGSAIPEMVLFMSEFALTGGLEASANNIAKQGVKQILKKAPDNLLKKFTTTAIGDLTGAATRATVMPEFYSGIEQRMTGDVEPVIENGKLKGVPIKETQAGIKEAIGKSYLTTLTEVATENFGKYTDNAVGLLSKKYTGGAMTNLLTNKTINQLKSATGFNSIISEFAAEEIPAAYIQGAIEGQKMSDVWDNKQMLTTALTIAATGGFFHASSFALNKFSEDRNTAVSDLRDVEKVITPEVQIEIDNSLKGENVQKNVEQLDTYIKKKVSEGATKEDVSNIVNYAVQKTRVDEMNSAENTILNDLGASKEKTTETPTEEKKVPVEAPKQEINTSPEGKTTIGDYELNDLEQKQYDEMVQEKGQESTDKFFKMALELHPPEIYNIQPGEGVKAEVESKIVSPQELSDLYIKDTEFRKKVNQRAQEQGRDYSTIDDKQYVYDKIQSEKTIIEPKIESNETEVQGETTEEIANVQQVLPSAELQQTNVEPLKIEQNAEGVRTQTENGGQQTQGLVEGEEGRLRLRDDVESGIPTQEQKENDVEENFHSAVTKGLDRGIEWLDNLDKELSKFSKETLGVNLPVVVAKAAINSAKLTLQAGKTVSEAVDSAINYVKSSDWYKSLGNDDKVKAENDIRDIFNKKPSEVVKPTEEQFTAIPSGTKERVTAKKALASKELSDEVKKAVEENKTYTVSNHKAMKERFSKIVNKHVESGNIDELKSIVLNENSNLQPESRIILASAFVEEMETLASTSENKIESDYYKEQSKDVFSNYLLPLSTQIAKGLKAFDVLTDVIGRNPDLYVESLRDKINNKNEDTLKVYENDVLNSKRIIDEYIQSDEFKRLLDKKVKEATVDKTLSADRIERGRAKMASGSSKILKALGTLKNAINEGEKSGDTLKQIGEGLVEFADGLLDVGVVSVESLLREIKVKFREYLTPSEIDNFKEEILKKTDAKNRVRPTKKYSSRDVLSDAELNMLVNSVYGKMVSANKKQLRKLAIDYLDRIIESNVGGKGEINDASFKELFANAIGLDTLTPKHEAVLRDVAGKLNDARNITNNLDWLYGEAEKVSNNTDKASKLLFDKLNKIIDVQFSEYKKAIKEANDANKKASKIFTEELSYGDLGATFLQGNLITPASQITNVVGNTFVLVPRTAAYFVGNVTDMIWYGVDKALFAIKNKYNNIDFIRRKLSNVEPERHFSLIAAGKGYSIGFAQGLIEGTQQLVNGQLPDDVFIRELKRGLEPIRRGIENFRMLSGKEQLRISKFIKNTFEATLGLSPEITFRFLNLGDKPFRRAAEQSRLYELADLNGLKGIAKERFINLPPEWALEEARNAGLKATYQNDNLISDFLLKAKNTSSQKYQHAVEGLNKVDKAMWGIGKFFLKSQIPFVKTPTNVMIETFEFGIPVFSLAKALYYSKAGDSRNASIYFGKFVVGSLMDAAITSIIYSGVLTLGQAQGEEDEEAKKRVRESEYRNVQAYSINKDAFWRWVRTGDGSWNENDEYGSYKRFGLFSSLLMGRAEALKGQDLGSKDDIFSVTSTLERQVASVFPMVRASLQQSYLSGVNTLLSSVFGGDEDIDKWIINTSRAFSAAIIPQTYVKINDSHQKYMKERRDEAVAFINKKDKTRDWEGIKKQWEDLYGSGDNLTNKITVWGEDIRYIPDGKSLAWYLFNITQSKVYNGDFGVKLHELYLRTKEEKVLPSPEPIQVKFEGIPIKLTADLRYELEKEFRSYRRNEIELFVNSNDYDLMNDEDRLFYLQAEYNRVNAYKGEFVNEFIERNYPQIEKLWETQKK